MSHRPFAHAARTVGMLALLLVTQALAFLLTRSLYRGMELHPSILLVQLINTLLGLFILVLAMWGFSVLFHWRRGQPFAPIIDTLQRIAKGDFTARLDDRYGSHRVVGELVQNVNQMASQLDQMEKMRQEFISNVSHEIQSPLTSIRGFACALQDNNLTEPDRSHYLQIIETESARLSRLSANLLKLAALESDPLTFKRNAYRLDTQIRDIILACEPQWGAKHLELDASLPEATITADEDLLGQVWTNLIHNSVKFTPAGGSVHVALEARADRVEVTIADTGVGILPEDQPLVFDRFYKADKSRRRSEDGNGLGLSIAKKVVEMHGGKILLRSEPGAGAAFTVELPLTPV